MTAWDAVVDAALVGTSRVQWSGTLLAPLDGMPADTLLAAGAILSRGRRAGFRPAAAGRDLPEPAAEEATAVVGGEAEALLRRMFAKERALLVEGLSVVASAGRLLPPLLLPPVLEAGRHDHALRAAALPVLGERAAWLARHNPNWSWAIEAIQTPAAIGPDDWETAARPERLAALAALRRTDPCLARGLVESTWAVDSWAERAAQLATLRVGLSREDEPLLERALDDGRMQVRTAAAEVLVRLRQSHYARRAQFRAARLLKVHRSPFRTALSLALPQADDPELLRDTAGAAAPAGTGAMAWHLERTVAVAPPRIWRDICGLEPAQLLTELDKTEWASEFRRGLRAAVLREPDPEWVLALFGDDVDPELLRALPLANRETVVGRLFDGEHAVRALVALPGPWSARLSGPAAELVDRIAVRPTGGQGENELVAVAGYRLDPGTELLLLPSEVHPQMARPYTDSRAALWYRAALRRAIFKESS